MSKKKSPPWATQKYLLTRADLGGDWEHEYEHILIRWTHAVRQMVTDLARLAAERFGQYGEFHFRFHDALSRLYLDDRRDQHILFATRSPDDPEWKPTSGSLEMDKLFSPETREELEDGKPRFAVVDDPLRRIPLKSRYRVRRAALELRPGPDGPEVRWKLTTGEPGNELDNYTPWLSAHWLGKAESTPIGGIKTQPRFLGVDIDDGPRKLARRSTDARQDRNRTTGARRRRR